MLPPNGFEIRPANKADASQIAAIYAPFVEQTAISFEKDAPDTAEMERRIATTSERYPYLVATESTGVVAFAYASRYRPRPAYRFTAEVSIYSKEHGRGRGIATALYSEVLESLNRLGFHTAIAIITLPNDASIRFHERMGFQRVGVLEQVGHKFGAWHDTGIWQRHLVNTEA